MGSGRPCRPDTVGGFSAVGYFFGRQLHQMLDVPVGLINDSWGGSACEAWVRRDILAADPKYAPHAQAMGTDSRKTILGQGRYESSIGLPAEGQGRGQTAAPGPAEPRGPDARQFPARQHLQRRAQADDRLRHPGRHLVPGGVERRQSLSVSRLVPTHDQELARRVGPGRFFVLLGPARRLPGRNARTEGKCLGRAPRGTDHDHEAVCPRQARR